MDGADAAWWEIGLRLIFLFTVLIFVPAYVSWRVQNALAARKRSRRGFEVVEKK